MSDLQVLTAVRGHLLNEKVALHIHLALPPQAIYPLLLVELEEIWSHYPVKGKALQRAKFKVGIYSQSFGMEETACLSDKTRKALEGATLRLANKTSTLRFLASVAETSGKNQGGQPLRAIHHFYDCIIRG